MGASLGDPILLRSSVFVLALEIKLDLAAALDGLIKREASIIAAARAPGATAATIKAPMKG
jgi:hypothetical protein